MAEYTAVALQTVAAGQNVIFTESPIPCRRSYVTHRNGSGVFRLRGITNQCYARYKVSFGANISVPTGGTVEAISLAISLEGEPQQSATAIVTPAAVDEFGNVYVSLFVDAPRDCCMTVGIENTSTQPINVQNANLIVERVA